MSSEISTINASEVIIVSATSYRHIRKGETVKGENCTNNNLSGDNFDRCHRYQDYAPIQVR
jgi:hypothetical protein